MAELVSIAQWEGQGPESVVVKATGNQAICCLGYPE
jgi:hypothetical protein